MAHQLRHPPVVRLELLEEEMDEDVDADPQDGSGKIVNLVLD